MADVTSHLKSCISENLEERADAYRSLIQLLSSHSMSSEVTFDITESVAKNIMVNVKRDMFNDEKNMNSEAIRFMGCYISNEKLMDLLSLTDEQDILDLLIKLIQETEDKVVLAQCLWSLSQSKFEFETYKKNYETVLKSIYEVLSYESTATSIIYECLQVFKTLIDTVPEKVFSKVEDWFAKLFAYQFHEIVRVRNVAYTCLHLCQLDSEKKKIALPLRQLLVGVCPLIKSDYSKRMLEHLEDNSSGVFKIWRFIVVNLGKELHSDTVLINKLLEVVERAFKNPKSEFRIGAFRCWQFLINSFALNIDFFTHPKRIKLIMSPLKSCTSKTEDVAHARFSTWWFFMCKVVSKVTEHFDLVVANLLKYCFNYTKLWQNNAHERSVLMSPNSIPVIKYPNLLLQSVEALAQILISGSSNSNNYSFSIFVICHSHSILTPVLFIKHSQLIFGCVADALINLDSLLEDHFELGKVILQNTLRHVNSIAKQNPTKKESIDLVKDFFKLYSFIEKQSNPDNFLSSFVYEMLEMTIIGDFAFAGKILNSRLYHISAGSKLRVMMNGTLSNHLIHEFCKPTILKYSMNPRFYEAWSTIFNKAIFLEAAIEEVTEAAKILCPLRSSTLITLWVTVADEVYLHMEEIQQSHHSDNAEQDWACVFNTLLLPLKCLQEQETNFRSSVYQELVTVWSKLWHHFSSLVSLNITSEPNFEADFICGKMLNIVREKIVNSPDDHGFCISFFADILHIVIDKFRFREIGKKTKKLKQSPLKPKNRSHLLCKLGSCVDVLVSLMDKTLLMISHWRQRSMQKLCLSLAKIFNTISLDKYIWVTVFNMVDILRKTLQINPSAKFEQEVEQTIVSMWASFCDLIECRVIPKITQDQLNTLSPLISVALISSHAGIKQRTRAMWSNFFASTRHIIPSELFDTLKAVALPPASIIDDVTGESQSLSPKENIPTHISGSFLNREKNQNHASTNSPKHMKDSMSPLNSSKLSNMDSNISVNTSKTPKDNRTPFSVSKFKTDSKTPLSASKSLTFRTPTSVNRTTISRLSIDELKSEEFVKVSSPKISKRLLTPHQAEKMRERACDIPALYSDMSQSCSQLPSQFLSQDSNMGTLEAPENKSEVGNDCLTFEGKIGKGKKELNFSMDSSNQKKSPVKSNRLEDENIMGAELIDLPDTSLEFSGENALSESAFSNNKQDKLVENNVRKSPRPKYNLTYTKKGIIVNEPKNESTCKSNEIAESVVHKRKSLTPHKKSIEDIRNTLKGNLRNRSNDNTSSSKYKAKGKRVSIKTKIEKQNSFMVSPLASPLKSPLESPVKSCHVTLKNLDVNVAEQAVRSLEMKSPGKSPKKVSLSPSKISSVSKSLSLKDGKIYCSPVKSTSNTSIQSSPSAKKSPMKSNIDAESNSSSTKSYKKLSLESPTKTKMANSSNVDDTASTKGSSNSDSENEIPNSQMDSTKSSVLLLFPFNTPKNSDSSNRKTDDTPVNVRPKRNKRKDVFDDDTPSSIPSKRLKKQPSEKSLDESVIILESIDLQVAEKSGTPKYRKKRVVGLQPDDYYIKTRDLLLTPSKVTRSGRRIIIPNKDMPEPMVVPDSPQNYIRTPVKTSNVSLNSITTSSPGTSLSRDFSPNSSDGRSESTKTQVSTSKVKGLANDDINNSKEKTVTSVINNGTTLNNGNKESVDDLSLSQIKSSLISRTTENKESVTTVKEDSKQYIQTEKDDKEGTSSMIIKSAEKYIINRQSLILVSSSSKYKEIESSKTKQSKYKILYVSPSFKHKSKKDEEELKVLSDQDDDNITLSELKSKAKNDAKPIDCVKDMNEFPTNKCNEMKAETCIENLDISHDEKCNEMEIQKESMNESSEDISYKLNLSDINEPSSTSSPLPAKLDNSSKPLSPCKDTHLISKSDISESGDLPSSNKAETLSRSPNSKGKNSDTNEINLTGDAILTSPKKARLGELAAKSLDFNNQSSKKVLIITSPKGASSPKTDIKFPHTVIGLINKIDFTKKSNTSAKKIIVISNNFSTVPKSDSIDKSINDDMILKEPSDLSSVNQPNEEHKPQNNTEISFNKPIINVEEAMEVDPNSDKQNLANIDDDSEIINENNSEMESIVQSESDNVSIDTEIVSNTSLQKHFRRPRSRMRRSKNRAKEIQNEEKETTEPDNNNEQQNIEFVSNLSKNVSETPNESTSKLTNSVATPDFKKLSANESPNKVSSKLSNSVGTPERKKISAKKVQIPGSRAAMMVACAKKTMKTRTDENCESPSAQESKLSLASSCAEETMILESPGVTPNRKRSMNEVYSDGKPWAKHEPSPAASPCSSILKKRHLAEDEAVSNLINVDTESAESSPCTSKPRRVSFAEPPVSESVEIPPSPKPPKGCKVQKRLDMTPAFIVPKEDSQDQDLSLEKIPSCSQPLYSPLLSCSHSIDLLAPLLTSPSLVYSLKVVFAERGMTTIGDFCAISEAELLSLPVRSPKISKTLKALKRYERRIIKEEEGSAGDSNVSIESFTINNVDLHPTGEPSKEGSSLPKTSEEGSSLPEPSEERSLPETSEEGSLPDRDLPLIATQNCHDPAPLDISAGVNAINNGLDKEGNEKMEKMNGEQLSDVCDVNMLSESEVAKSEIKESEFPLVFIRQIERDSKAIPSFVDGLSLPTRQKLLESLTAAIPYKNVIDLFHKYLSGHNAE